ncbi:MAG: beta-N-acetylhexosaminidase [bacterium]|nr:beta-N-acetylhexosaminidase [bacterium]
MMKKLLATMGAGLILAVLASCEAPTEPKAYNQGINIIPAPASLVQNEGAFKLGKSTNVFASTPEAKTIAEFFIAKMNTATGYATRLAEGTGSGINLVIDESLDVNDEGYTLEVNAKEVIVKAKKPAGLFYGMQSFMQLLPAEIESASPVSGIAWTAPAVSIKDEPRFGYRGIMFDPCRHFMPVENVKKHIDVLALFKINRMHWHLTDDQGWRIEIKKYPKLTEVGSTRKETITEPRSNEYDGTPVSGFYTQEEAREIVRYAADRFITVIPEIDLPGHMMAALASYPELGCTGGPYEIPTRFGVFDEVLCGGNEQTLQFAKDVLNEIMDIFPSPYIHIGGDECPKVRWEKCPKCQAKIRELGLKSTREHSKENQLQVWFMSEVEKEINARGRKMMGWDEILEGNPEPSVTVMGWTSPKASIQSAQLGHPTIVTPIQYLYFSNPWINHIMGEASVERVYNFEPVADTLTLDQRKNIIGAQGCIWTEWTKDSVKMEWQMMPRIDALSELQWTQPDKKDFKQFLQRLQHQLKLYELKGWNYKSLNEADSLKYKQFKNLPI